MEKIQDCLSKLKTSKFRAKFKLPQKELDYYNKKGYETIKNHAYDFITKKLAPASPKNDGKQTPMKNHPVFIAQHATATCCRGCMEKWWNIKQNKELSKNEIDFAVELIMAWLENEIEKDVS